MSPKHNGNLVFGWHYCCGLTHSNNLHRAEEWDEKSWLVLYYLLQKDTCQVTEIRAGCDRKSPIIGQTIFPVCDLMEIPHQSDSFLSFSVRFLPLSCFYPLSGQSNSHGRRVTIAVKAEEKNCFWKTRFWPHNVGGSTKLKKKKKKKRIQVGWLTIASHYPSGRNDKTQWPGWPNGGRPVPEGGVGVGVSVYYAKGTLRRGHLSTLSISA